MTDLPDILILQAGQPPEAIRDAHGDLPLWFCRTLGRPADAVQVVRIYDGEPLPPPDARRVAIITGSWSMVTERLPWSEAAAAWIRAAMAINMPLFGVCYGHQLMAHALSGEVGYHPAGREIGTQTVRLLPAAAEDGLVSVMPQEFAAHLTHMQTVLDLPPGAQVLAASDHDPHQIVRFGPNAISTQFHPEFTPEISRAVIHLRSDALRGEGKDPDALMAAVDSAPEPVSLLRRFVEASLGRNPRPEQSATETET